VGSKTKEDAMYKKLLISLLTICFLTFSVSVSYADEINLPKQTQTVQKILHKSSDKVFFGVCGGLAEYFNVDPTLVRAGFVVFSLLGGSGVLVYLVLVFIMPSPS
jgi:phage shock protein C